MEHGISLCVAYNYITPSGSPIKSLYRIADYADGLFQKIDTQLLNDYTDSFSPKYIRCRPGEEPDYYVPVVKEWTAVPKNGDFDKSITESFPCDRVKFFEVVVNQDYMGSDNDHIINLLRNGIELPDGIADNILIAFDQDEECYQVVFCKKSYFKYSDGKYYVERKIEDVLHARHSLDVFYVYKSDLISTRSFGYFFCADGSVAPERFFYAYDELPQLDRRLYLYRFDEYLPIYLSKYMKTHSKEVGLSKSNIQVAITAIRDALSNDREMNSFFRVAGFQQTDIEDRLPYYRDLIISHLDGSDFLNSVITRLLLEDEELEKKFVACAKEQWLSEKDQERIDIEFNLTANSKKNQELEALNEELCAKCDELEKKRQKLQELSSTLMASIEAALSGLDTQIEEHIAKSAIYRMIGSRSGISNTVSTSVSRNSSCIVTLYPDENTNGNKYIAPDITKACKVLESNLRVLGMRSPYSMVLSNIFIATKPLFHSVIVNGMYARGIGDAFSYSIDGQSATRITLSSISADYREIQDAVAVATGKVIIVENLLDTCNELIISTIIKDFPEKLFIFSIDNEDNYRLLSKGIWTYGLLINTDSCMDVKVLNQNFKPACLGESIVVQDIDADISNYHELMKSLAKIGLPISARVIFAKTMAHLIEHRDCVDPLEYIDSVLAKFCEVYKNDIDPDDLDMIQKNLNIKFHEIYDF